MAQLATVATFGFPDFDPPVILDLFRRLGCTRAQFYRNEDNPPVEQDVLRICRDAGLVIDSIHGVFGDKYDPSSPDPALRQAAVDVYRREGELALRLGGPMVVVHPAPMLPPTRDVPPEDRALRVAPLLQSMRDLADIGRRLGVVYLFENLTPKALIGQDPRQLADLIRQVASDHLRMCFDTGHAQLTGSVAPSISACSDVIAYMHVHDNDGREDSHLMPGDGVMNWNSVGHAISDADLRCSAMLEVFYLRDKLAEYLKPPFPDRLKQWLAIKP
jgi:sugar phosphate isomerase/epimerase